MWMADLRWEPSILPSIGVEMSREQRLACAFRHLDRINFCENLGGHITWADRDDGSMLVNPWGLWWAELSASDICRVSRDGNVIEGTWDVTPAIHIHTELHRSNPDARVVIHNHPYWVTVLAALGDLPEIFHQTGCLFHEEMIFIDEYDGTIEDAESGSALASAIGDHRVSLLANHGVIVTGDSLASAVYRAASFERQCRLAYDVLRSGQTPRPLPHSARQETHDILADRAPDIYWAGAVRQLLKADPGVLK
jgi:ribulose-5-phosphate 4-epimerase/fuculose-1-phosphate aldolase